MVYTIDDKDYDFFEKSSLVSTLRTCEEAGYSALFMPEFARLKIAHPRLFKDWGRTMSIRATGRTSAGSAIEIYAHVAGEWSERQYISDMISERRFINYALPLRQASFDALEKRADERDASGVQLVTVMDHAKAQKGRFGQQTLSQALENPHVRAFFGNEELTEGYVEAHKAVHGENILFYHSNDLGSVPVARPLLLDDDNLGGISFNYCRRVPGVRRRLASVSEPVSTGGATQKKLPFSIDALLADEELRNSIPEECFLRVEKILRTRYQ